MAITKNSGLPSAADLILVLDNLAGAPFKAGYSTIGIGAPSESSTVFAKKMTGRAKTLGDGTTTNPGLTNVTLKSRLSPIVDDNVLSLRYDKIFGMIDRNIFTTIEQVIRDYLPPTWNFVPSGTRLLDAWLTRLNGNNSNIPATPSVTVTPAATTGGTIPSTTTSAEPRFKITYVNTYDCYESQASNASAQVALTGGNNAYSLTFGGGNVPTGVTKVRIYRQLDNNAGGSDPYYFVKDVDVVAGVAFSSYTFLVTDPDQSLRFDINPPTYLSCTMLPEVAVEYALSYLISTTTGDPFDIPAYSSLSMFNPLNVVLNPVSGFLGIANPASTGTLGTVNTTTLTTNSIITANNADLSLQGFAGASNGVQARVTSALSTNATLTNITYTYWDAAHPYTDQSATIAGPLTLNSALGQTVSLGVTAGRIVRAITACTTTGPASGQFIFEAIAARSI